ncbi:hypothetical protein [Pseudomonas syringae]
MRKLMQAFHIFGTPARVELNTWLSPDGRSAGRQMVESSPLREPDQEREILLHSKPTQQAKYPCECSFTGETRQHQAAAHDSEKNSTHALDCNQKYSQCEDCGTQ